MEVKYEMRKIIRIESVIEMVGCVEVDPEFWNTDRSSNPSREGESGRSALRLHFQPNINIYVQPNL